MYIFGHRGTTMRTGIGMGSALLMALSLAGGAIGPVNSENARLFSSYKTSIDADEQLIPTNAVNSWYCIIFPNRPECRP